MTKHNLITCTDWVETGHTGAYLASALEQDFLPPTTWNAFGCIEAQLSLSLFELQNLTYFAYRHTYMFIYGSLNIHEL